MTTENNSRPSEDLFLILISEMLPAHGEFVSIMSLWKGTPGQVRIEERMKENLVEWFRGKEMTPKTVLLFLAELRKTKRDLYQDLIEELIEVYLTDPRNRKNFGELTVPAFPAGRTLPETDWTILGCVSASKKVYEERYTNEN